MIERLTTPISIPDLDSYRPSPEQQAQANVLKRFILQLEKANVRYAVMGGYGLDGLYGRLTRDHNDIDILSIPEDAEQIRKVIQAAGFRLDIVKIRGGVEVYFHERTHTKLEFGVTNKISEYTDMSDDEFLPFAPNAALDSVSFRTATLRGHEEMAKIQMQRAQEGEWGPYAHAAWKARLMAVLRLKDPTPASSPTLSE